MRITIALAFAAILMGCGMEARREARAAGSFERSADFAATAAPDKSAPAAPAPSMDSAASSTRTEPGAAAVGAAAKTPSARKLVHRASFSIQVPDLAAAERAARQSIERLEGYIARASNDESSVYLTFRVPQASFGRAVAELPALGRVVNREQSAEDVTLRYFDLEGRLETKRALAATFRGYLKRADTIEDILAVETRLAELQNEIDALGGEFAHLADLVDYSTIDVAFHLPGAAVPVEGPTIAERLADLVKRFGGFLTGLLVGLVAVVMFGIPIALIAAVAYWLLFGRVGLLIRLFKLIGRKRAAPPSKD